MKPILSILFNIHFILFALILIPTITIGQDSLIFEHLKNYNQRVLESKPFKGEKRKNFEKSVKLFEDSLFDFANNEYADLIRIENSLPKDVWLCYIGNLYFSQEYNVCRENFAGLDFSYSNELTNEEYFIIDVIVLKTLKNQNQLEEYEKAFKMIKNQIGDNAEYMGNLSRYLNK